MKIQEETDVKEYQIRKKKSREQTVENMENKEKEVRETEPETTKEEDEHVKEMGMLSLDRRRNHQIELLTIIGEVEGHETVSGSTRQPSMSTCFQSWHRLRTVFRLMVC